MRGRAGLLLVIAACGDGVTLPDAAGGSDGPERGLVTVRIEKPDRSILDRVWFQNADSTIALATRPDAAGEASALMAPGGFVSFYDSARNAVYTWSGVQVADVLELDLTDAQSFDALPNASLRIDPLEGAVRYIVSNRCESFADVTPAIDGPHAPFFQPCTATSDLLLVALDDIDHPIGYRYTKNANIQSSATIDLRGPYSPFDTTVTVRGPAETTINVFGTLAEVAYTTGTSAHISGSPVAVPLRIPGVANATAQITARTLSGAIEKDDVAGVRTDIAWGPASTTTTLDLSTPSIRAVRAPRFVIESYELRWTESEDGERGNIVWANLGLAGAQWFVTGPRMDETALRLPVLPTEALRPRSETVFIDNLALVVAEGGYDRWRPYLLGHWSPTTGTKWPMPDPSGRVSYRSTR